jgi:hypothetical protein
MIELTPDFLQYTPHLELYRKNMFGGIIFDRAVYDKMHGGVPCPPRPDFYLAIPVPPGNSSFNWLDYRKWVTAQPA